MSDDCKEKEQPRPSLENLAKNPLEIVFKTLGPGERQVPLVNKDWANIAGKNSVYSYFLEQEDEKKINNKKGQPTGNEIKLLGKGSIFQQQTARKIFKNYPHLRSSKYYPRFIAEEFDHYPAIFFSRVLKKNEEDIAAQSGFAFWSIYKVNPAHSQQKELIQKILDIAKDNPTHIETLYYLAKLMESGYLDSSRLKMEMPNKDKNLGEIIYEALGESIRKAQDQEVYTALGEKFKGDITSQMLYDLILLLDPSHPGASYARVCALKEHKTQTTEVVAERARLLRNVWPVDHRDFGALCEFIEMMYEGLIEPTEKDFVVLNQLLERGRTEPTTILAKLQLFVDYANAKGNDNPKLRAISASLLEDREAVRRLSLFTQHFEFLKNIEQLPYHQQRLLIEAAKKAENREIDSIVISGLVLYGVSIYAVSMASFCLATGDWDFATRLLVGFFMALVEYIFCGILGMVAHSVATPGQIFEEESSTISHLQETFHTHWATFFPGMDENRRRQDKPILELQLLPKQQRQSINNVLENFNHLETTQKENIISAAHDVHASYASKLFLAKTADSLPLWFVITAILASSSYAMYVTHAQQINKSLSIRMETLLAEVVLASIIAYMAYVYLSRNVPKVMTNYVYEQQQNGVVARVAEVAEVKSSSLVF